MSGFPFSFLTLKVEVPDGAANKIHIFNVITTIKRSTSFILYPFSI